MTVKFPTGPGAMMGAFSPLRFEAYIHDCEVEGEIPPDLNGTFYRTGPDRRFPSRFPNDSLFNDDGFVDLFRIADGHVDFRSRYVRTERFLAERKAHKSLFGLYRNKYTSDPSVRDLSMNVANTNVIYHGNKLLVLKESDPPIALHPETLETLAEWSFHGTLTSPTFTAHPKIDPVTGEMIAFGYEAKGEASRDIAMSWIDKDGKVTREAWVEAPYVSMLHDIAVSKDHIVIPTTGFTTSAERLKNGEIHWGFDPDQTIYVGIMRRDGDGKDLRWFQAPSSGQMIHTINAVTEGDKLILDAPISDGNPFPFFPAVDGSPFNPAAGLCTVRRWTFDLSTRDGNAKEEILFPDHKGGGLSRMDDRFVTRPFRYSFMGIADLEREFDESQAGNLRGRITNVYARFDHQTGNVDTLFAGPTHSLSESAFAPRSREAPESDGYVLGVANNLAENRSELIIADATKMSDGVIARVKMPFRLHGQVHGNWIPGWDLDASKLAE